MTLLLPHQPAAPFQVIDGNALDLILAGRPFQPEQGARSVYRIKERLRGSKSRVSPATDHIIAIRQHQGMHKLGVYQYDEHGEKPAELLVSFRLERVR